MAWSVVQSDCLSYLRSQPDDSADLAFTSPPYVGARLYLENGEDLRIARKAEDWVAWMVEVFRECVRVCKGLTAFVVEGQTKNYRYDCAPDLLRADLCRAGFNLRKSPIFQRVGIPGSGGPDWLRNDYESVVCVTRPGKLPWSDNTSCGHPPKWAPGGAMAHRLTDGQRVNQWGTHIDADGMVSKGGQDGATGKRAGRVPLRPSHKFASMTSRGANGERKVAGGRATRGSKNGDTQTADSYDPPALANPGNVQEQTYTFTASHLAELLTEAGNVGRHIVGGGVMGHPLAHENEAPFPLSLAEFYVRSFAPPGGRVLDPFAGSGTTGHACVLHGRDFLGCDLRESQVTLTRRRLEGVTPGMFV